MQAAVRVRGVGKQFHRYHADRPITLKQAVVGGLRRMRETERFWALSDVSFDVPAGRMLGVVGRNGAGKSTLLRLIGGVGRPDRGTVTVCGRVGALLDLGAGFQRDLSGRENIFVSGVIAGLTRREVAYRLDDIVCFAELEDFLDAPLRTYSSGMQMRLAFSIAAHTNPDVLLMDEILAVGDSSFQQKCMRRIQQFKDSGCAIILVSHDAGLVQRLCDEALWLRGGRVVAHGPAGVVAGEYEREMEAETRRRTPVRASSVLPGGVELQANQNRFGSMEMEITAVRLCGRDGRPIRQICTTEGLRIEIDYAAPKPIKAPIFSVTITCEDDTICLDTNNSAEAHRLLEAYGSGTVSLELERLDLNGGLYYVDVGVHEAEWSYGYDYHWHVYTLEVVRSGNPKGVLWPPHHWEVSDVSRRTGQLAAHA